MVVILQYMPFPGIGVKQLPARNWMVPQISKTEWVFKKQKRRRETRQRRDKMTAWSNCYISLFLIGIDAPALCNTVFGLGQFLREGDKFLEWYYMNFHLG
jgi:hypothetical protein